MMILMSKKLSLIVVVILAQLAFNFGDDAKKTSIFTDEIIKKLNNTDDFNGFKTLLENMKLEDILKNPLVKAGLVQAKIDPTIFQSIKTSDLLQIFDLPKVWEEVKKAGNGKERAKELLPALMKNIDTMKLIQKLDWTSVVQNAMKTGSISIPGSSPVSLECSLELIKLSTPILTMNSSMNDPSVIEGLTRLPIVRMIDSWAKLPSGILEGHFSWIGAYSECEKIEQSKYCYVDTFLFGLAPGKIGTCMPKKCTNTDVATLQKLVFSTLLPQLPAFILTLTPNAVCVEDSIKYSTGFKITVALCVIIMVLLVMGTFVDLTLGDVDSTHINTTINQGSEKVALKVIENKMTEQNDSMKRNAEEYGSLKETNVQQPQRQRPIVLRILMCFSLLKNTKAVISTDSPKGAIECINGIRAISMFWIILSHIYVFASVIGNSDNLFITFGVIIKRYISQAILNAYVAVDSFFLLSGLLVAYLTLKRMDKADGKINLIMFYVHRFIRLTPPYMFVILFWNNIFFYTVRGPYQTLTHKHGDQGFCNKYWWTNLLYINNLYPTKMQEECLGWSWYLANDMQFYIIAPGILILMFILERKYKESKFSFLGPLIVVVIGCTISIVIRMIIIGVNDYNALMSAPGSKNTNERQDALYVKPYTRISPYLIGLFLGYALSRKIGIEFLRKIRYIGWIIAILLGYAIVYGPYVSAYKTAGNNFNKTEDVFYGGFSSTAWAIAVSWVIYSCHNECGGLVNKFLSWKAWIPLSRLTFGAYLLHPLVTFYYFLVMQTPFHYQDNLMIFIIVSHIFLSYIAAFILAVGVEHPVLNLEKLAFQR